MPDVRAHLAAERRVGREDVRPGEEQAPEEHPSTTALDRRGKLARVRTRQDDLVPRRGLEGDVRARVARADDEDGAFLELREVAVVARVELGDVGIERAREVGHVGPLEDACRHDDVVGFELQVACGRHVAAVLLCEPVDGDPTAHGQLEAGRVGLQVVGHLVLRRVRGRLRREAHAGQAVPACGRIEPQRVPARPPAVAEALAGVEDHERPALLTEVVPHGEARLAASDHDRAVLLSRCHRLSPFVVRRGNGRAATAGGASPRSTNLRSGANGHFRPLERALTRGRARRQRRLPPRATRGGACGRCSARGGPPCAR